MCKMLFALAIPLHRFPFSQRLLFFIATTALWLPIRIAQGRSFEEVQTEVANSQ